MRSFRSVPEGFTVLPVARGVAVMRQGLAPALRAAGLAEPWKLRLGELEGGTTGRGPRAVVGVGGGEQVLVKQCLRGGWLARFNRSRYASPARFLRELDVGRRAEQAGCPVLPAIAVVVRPAGLGVRAWSMSRYLADAEDLAVRMQALPRAADRVALLERVLGALAQLFEAGLEHRDLNLGNVLVRPASGRSPELIRVIDLDRARWRGRPLPARAGRRVTARFERSWSKVLGPDGAVPAQRRRELEGLRLGAWSAGAVQRRESAPEA